MILVLSVTIICGAVFVFQKDELNEQNNKSLLEEFSSGGFRSAQSGNESNEIKNLKNYSSQAVLVDEIAMFKDSPEKMKYFADMNKFKNIRLAIVLHRTHENEASFDEVFKEFKTHFVHSLTIEEVGLLIRKPLEGTQIDFTDDAVKKIFEFTGGRPMEINNLCRALMESYSKHKNHKSKYEAEDIEELAGKNVYELSDSFQSAINTYGNNYEKTMSDEERAIIDKLCKGEIPAAEIDNKLIQPLLDTTFVRKDEEKNVYQINGELFKKAIEENQV